MASSSFISFPEIVSNNLFASSRVAAMTFVFFRVPFNCAWTSSYDLNPGAIIVSSVNTEKY